jgi:hypothetical protein
MDAEDWLRDTERKLDAVGCNDEEKLWYISYMLILTGPCYSVMAPEKICWRVVDVEQ